MIHKPLHRILLILTKFGDGILNATDLTLLKRTMRNMQCMNQDAGGDLLPALFCTSGNFFSKTT